MALSKAWIITLSILGGVLVIGAIVLAVLLTRPAAIPETSPTTVVTTTSLPTESLLIKNTLGACYQFGNLVNPNILILNPCVTGDHWVYDPNIKGLSYVASTYQTCMQVPTVTGSSVLGGNINCSGLVIVDNKYIETEVGDLCIINNAGTLQWGSCATPFEFNISSS